MRFSVSSIPALCGGILAGGALAAFLSASPRAATPRAVAPTNSTVSQPIASTRSAQFAALRTVALRVAPKQNPRFIRVGLSTTGGNLALWSRFPMTIVDAAQPGRKLSVAPQDNVTFSMGASTRIAASGKTYQGAISIRTQSGVYAAWQMPRIYPAGGETHFASDGGSAKYRRSYRGTFEIAPQTFTFDAGAHKSPLRAVNIVELDEYLKGVVPWEMDADAPLEALKAQAICARSETLSNISTKRFAPDGYDICDYDRCQGYPGTENEKPRTSLAVAQTAGMALFHKGTIAAAVYGTNDGGITASSEDVWKGPPEPYLKSVRDIDPIRHASTAKFLNRKMSETDWAEWCSRNWPTFAQPTPGEISALAARRRKSSATAALFQSGDLPNFYRWSRAIDARVLSSAMTPRLTASGQAPMQIATALRVLARAPSGHIKQLQIEGKSASGEIVSFTLSGDSQIRSMLSQRLGSTTALPSSTFAIALNGTNGWILKGAGWGHGAGMCQSGARNRALAGQNARRIVQFYFRDVEVKRIN